MIPKHTRRGFTLVELLIVIVVIGILSAMMMLSSTEAVTTAKASNIISNLRQLKTATLEWYVDHLDYIDTSKSAYISYVMTYSGKTEPAGSIYNMARDDPSEITRYINGGSNVTINGHSNWGDQIPDNSYGIMDGNSLYPKAPKGKWFVAYRFPANGETRLKEKIAGRAKSVGLISGWNTTTDSGKIYDVKTNSGKFAYMEILDLGDVK